MSSSSFLFKIVEKSGISLEQKLRKSNPWGGERCGRQNCFQCKTDEGGDCWRESVTYSLVCEECGEDVCKYFGESGRNGFSRGEEHLANLEAADENKSILKLHSIHHHNGREVNFTMKVTDVHSSCLDRQAYLIFVTTITTAGCVKFSVECKIPKRFFLKELL